MEDDIPDILIRNLKTACEYLLDDRRLAPKAEAFLISLHPFARCWEALVFEFVFGWVLVDPASDFSLRS
jgi:hypothetical protein